MNKKAKIGIVLFAGIAAAVAAWYFFIRKPKPQNQTEQPGAGTSGTTGILGQVIPQISTPAPVSDIGKSAYAKQDNVQVLEKATAQVMRIKNKNEFVGTIAGSTTLGGAAYYTLGNGGWVVAKSKVTLR